MAHRKADAPARASRPFLVTFSGIDGAGKTTQIERLSSYLEKQGLRVVRLSFWDHVAVWSKMRAGVGQRTVDSRHADPTFTPKNNKHVRKWYLIAARLGFYMLDLARLRRVLASPEIKKFDVVIFDRFIYDQFANISSRSLAVRCYGRILLKLAPVPDLAFVLDASPAAAFARKPEYPLEFVIHNRQNFLCLRELAPKLIIISEAKADDVTNEICFHIGQSRLRESTPPEEKTDIDLDSAVIRLRNSPTVRNNPTTASSVPSKG
jgi:thymidylate kinase